MFVWKAAWEAGEESWIVANIWNLRSARGAGLSCLFQVWISWEWNFMNEHHLNGDQLKTQRKVTSSASEDKR